MLKILDFEEHTDVSDRRRAPARPRWLTASAALAVVAVAGLALWAYGSARPPAYETVRPRIGTAVLAIYGTGEVTPVSWAKLATVQSARLMELNAREGDTVRKGEVVARQDTSVELATLAELEARQRFFEEDLARKEKLAERDIVSRQSLAQIRASAEEYAAKVRAQKERIGLLSLVSPLDGVVLRRDGELGELIPAGTTVMWVGDPEELEVVAAIDEEDIALVRPGQRVLVKSDAFPDRSIEGRIDRITLKGDPVAKTFRVRVALPEDSGLMIGMTAEINIIVEEKANALLVPATAVSGDKVAVVEDGRPQWRTVETGIRSGADVEITSGITREDEIVRDGAKIPGPAAAAG